MRLGVMCTGSRFAAWEAECLDRLVSWRTRVWHCSSSTCVRKLGECGRGRSIGCGGCLRSDRILWSARLQGVSVVACDVSRRGRFSECFGASNIGIS